MEGSEPDGPMAEQYQNVYHTLVNTDLKAFNTMLGEKGILTINAMK